MTDEEFINSCQFAVICGYDGKVVHIVLYEERPDQDQLDLLREELATDEEFALQDIVNDIEFEVIEKPKNGASWKKNMKTA